MIFVVGNVKVNVDHQCDVCSLGQSRAAPTSAYVLWSRHH